MLLPLLGRNICYDILGGEDRPVVCFGHALASDSGMWTEQVAPLLAEGYRVLRVDMRGHGGSTPVPGVYSIEQLAGDILSVADTLGIKQMHYVGLSIGGMIGQMLGVKHAARVKSLMLCDTSASAPPDAKERWNPRMAQVQAANSMAPLAETTMGRWLTEKYKAAHPGRWKQIYESVLGASPQGYIGCSTAIQNFDLKREIPNIKAPALVVFGGDDPGADPEGNRLLAKLIPGSSFEEVPGARHLPNVEEPEIFNKLMLDFLNKQK